MSQTEAQLFEIFDSIQGEGTYLGVRQLFIRFCGCNLSCAYCDTQLAELSPRYKVEQTAGLGDFKQFNNPISASQLLQIIADKLGKKPIQHSISLTGGEPLLQVNFLKTFLPEVRKFGLPIYLETNGVLPDHLGEIIDLVDLVALDYKLPSATGLSDYALEHKKSLQIALAKEVFVKVVFTKDARPLEIDAVAKLIAAINPEICLVLQPATPHGTIKHWPTAELMLALYAVARRSLKNVRLIPQVHKIMKVL
ncbi:MAG: 7-carboxy-7-deazaguanine synthase QueE [Candidatus Margulisiibacteriota bacterium]